MGQSYLKINPASIVSGGMSQAPGFQETLFPGLANMGNTCFANSVL